MHSYIYRSKRAQIGETMTWIVATLVIVVILGISVFVAVPLGKLGGFKFDRKADLLATKSLANYLSNGGEYIKLKQGGKLGESSKRMVEYYEDDYAGSSEIVVEGKFDPLVGSEIFNVECDVDVRIDLGNGKEVSLCLGSEID